MMPQSASTQLNRIVQLVAELSRREREGRGPVTLQELADHLGTRPSVVMRDIRVLTEAADDPKATWLLSLSAYQEGERVGVSSLGPYRRPIRFTSDELLALQVALVTESEPPSEVLRSLAGLMDVDERTQAAETISPVPFLHGGQAAVVELAHIALNARQRVKLLYAGEGADEPSVRVTQIHDVVASEGNHYLIAWCERAEAWRRFRTDRVLEAELLAGSFEWRIDAPTIESAKDLFEAPPEAVDEVRIRFSPRISRWIRERYTDAEVEDDGSTVVTFRTSSMDWLVRSVLQYGDEAEVIEPAAYREAVRRAVAV